ncbi:MAG: hypothetical protein JNM84_27130 [Planctomycetes bacterium]|nr:hypothetical protein [Planctomycetota bacterium]
MPSSLVARFPLLLSSLVLLSACSQTTSSAETEPREANAPGPMTAEVEKSFEPGVAIADRTELLAWLATHAREGGSGATLKLPIALELRDGGAHLGDAHLGLEGGDQRLTVLLDDSALGVALVDRARHHMRSDGTCALWLEGVWLGATQSGGRFAVSAVRGAIGASGREAASRVYVASGAAR